MSLQNFVSLRCAKDASGARPTLCDQLGTWVDLQKKGSASLLTFGAPGVGGAPIKPE